MLLLDPLMLFNYCFFLALLFFVDICCVVPDPFRCPSLRILRWSQRAIGKYRTTYLRWGRLQWFIRSSKFTFGTWSDHVRPKFNSLLCANSAKPGNYDTQLEVFHYLSSQAYEKRQRGEEEEEAEDEISSHKTIVTKFLNRVITNVQTRIGCFRVTSRWPCLMPLNKRTAAMLVSPTNPRGI